MNRFGLKANNSEKIILVPGPGNYEPWLPMKSCASTKFGKSSKLGRLIGEITKTPGPGLYDILNNPVLKKAPSFGFGTEERKMNLKKSVTPGPGSFVH